MTIISVEVKGLDHLTARLNQLPAEVRGPIATKMLTDAALEVERQAKERAPVDTGRLRSSITHEVRDLEARIGTNVHYGPYQEFGTRPHFPPVAALKGWARRHGVSARAVQRSIGFRGTEAHPYLLPGFEAAQPAIGGHIADAERAVSAWWESQ